MAASRRILNAVQSIPEDAVYRRNLEKIYSHRLHVCEQSESVEQVEATLQEGQIEELVKIANDEENLIPVMKQHKPWEVPQGHTVEWVEDNLPTSPADP